MPLEKMASVLFMMPRWHFIASYLVLAPIAAGFLCAV